MGGKKPLLGIALVLALVVLVRSPRAIAAPLAYGQDVSIPVGQEVKNLILVGGNAEVAGTVKDEVVVVYGNLILKPTARVGDQVTVVGGQLIQEPGAAVGKDIYRFDLGSATLNGLLLGAGAFLGLEVLRLVAVGGLIAAVLLVNLLLAGLTARAGHLAETRPGQAALLGITATGASVTLAGLLALTVVGIPLAALLLVFVALLSLLGLSAVGHKLGETLAGRSAKPRAAGRSSAALGGLLLGLASSAPVVGPLVFAALLVVGVGVSVLYLVEARGS